MKPRHRKGGWADRKTMARGPRGFLLCRFCSNECPSKARTFCSQECVDQWNVRTGNRLDKVLKKRDHGICAICSFNCDKIPDKALYRALHNIPAHRKRLWDIDHIIPVVEGGGDCDASNLRTLCIPCHRGVTAELRTRLKEQNGRSTGD